MMVPASAAAFRPHSPGDDPQNANLAIDGQHGTAWRTDWYSSAQFGNLYSGTGLLLDMGQPVMVTGIRVTLGAAAGAHFQIRVGDQPNLGALRPVGRWAGPGGIVRLGLNVPPAGVMYWSGSPSCHAIPPGPTRPPSTESGSRASPDQMVLPGAD